MSVFDRARSPLAIADTVFATLQRGPDPLAIHPGELAAPQTDNAAPDLEAGWGGQPIPLARLRELLRDPDTGCEFKNRAWSVLVARAQQHGGAWTVGAVGVALGPLVRLATELAGGDRDNRPDLDAEVLAGFLHALVSANPRKPQLFPHLLREARRAGLTWLRHQRAADTPICHTSFGSQPPSVPWGHPDLVLADAVAAGAITASEAALIGATRLDDIAPQVIAWREQTGVEAIWKRRRRAEHRLAAYLSDQIAQTAPSSALDPTALAALAPTRLGPGPARAEATSGTAPAATEAVRFSTVHRHNCPEPPAAAPSYRRGSTPTEPPHRPVHRTARARPATASPAPQRPATPRPGSRPAQRGER